jgi:L-lactate transport
MNWAQNYTPVGGSLGLSALAAALPLFALLYLLGVRRTPSWVASLCGASIALAVALFLYGMPLPLAASAMLYGAAFGLFPITWVIFPAIFLYRITVETGQFEIIKDSIGSLTQDRRVQALLIAFAFGAFIEGAAGFGTPVAVASAMLTGLGFTPFYAAGICLLANTAPVAFGSIGIPLITLAGITSLPLDRLSAGVGRICAPVSLFIPAYLMLVMGGLGGLRAMLPAVAVCGVAFAGAQFFVSNFVGPQLTDIISSLAAIGALMALLRFWHPRVIEHHETRQAVKRHAAALVARAWTPYVLLVLFVLVWGLPPVKAALGRYSIVTGWPGLHNVVLQAPPVAKVGTHYAATYRLDWLSASGTACLMACLFSLLLLRVPIAKARTILLTTLRQLKFPTVTVMGVLGLAFLMNYCGATATLGLAFASTGVLFPFFSAILGWLGVFLTGSDTSSNALFGNLQVVTANKLGLSPVLMAASNSSGGVMGKMISLQSIAVAAAATSMKREDESRLFRFTLRHSVLLASVIGLVTLFYAYVQPGWAP